MHKDAQKGKKSSSKRTSRRRGGGGGGGGGGKMPRPSVSRVTDPLDTDAFFLLPTLRHREGGGKMPQCQQGQEQEEEEEE